MEYDIILVYYNLRIHPYYLNIIHYFSKNYKIGIFIPKETDYSAKVSNHKSIQTQTKFQDACKSFGAETIDLDKQYSTKILFLPNGSYSEQFHQKLNGAIHWEQLFAVFNIWDFKLQSVIDFYDKWDNVKFFTPFLFMFDKINTYNGDTEEVENYDIAEIGLPYKQYPVFGQMNFDIDYIIAMPTIMKFKEGADEKIYHFLKMLTTVLEQTDESDKVYIKQHTVKDDNHLVTVKEKGIKFEKLQIAFFTFLLSFASLLKISFIKKKLYHFLTVIYYTKLIKTYPTLNDISEYANFPIEMFMPYVRKGILTGRSTTQFHALYMNLPIYNCDPQEDNEFLKKTAKTWELYGVDCCNGRLDFDTSHFYKIDQTARERDMIKIIEEEINKSNE